ncbi:bifunctional lysylphosphatidylglycerol flippase/synthetase MprF [Acuticoccus yangtzensis]|uniref:bifunctional lysylphosphatidylglycerol flippase/synthetase MprF n=1 Tax=Acuticoccus yangtzensis TaxID=1443441 RepID=UPI0009496296|nr:bifunctional lysylphosphatidylglycerol flippase/synthetase MprF [Acuticoccus yangtzensis]
MQNQATPAAALQAHRRAIQRMRAFVRPKRVFHPRRLAALGALVLAGAIAVLLVDMLEGVAARDVASAVGATSGLMLIASAIASAGSYTALMGFEWLAVRQAGAAVPPRLAAFTGFISWAFTFVLGFGVITGGAVRLRRYGRAGLSAGQTVRITLFGAVFFWLGIAALAGLSLVAAPSVLQPLVGLSPSAATGIGLAVTLLLAVVILRGGRSVTLGGQRLTLPDARTGLAVAGLGIADTGLAALGLWCVLPAGSDIGFLHFLPIFAMATVAGVVSHAPGGVGAFEAVILILVPGAPSELLASLLVFRLVYYVAPFVIGAVAFALAELAPQRHRLSTLPRLLGPVLAPMVPLILSAAVFAAGLVLLVAGALPGASAPVTGVLRGLPIPFVEASHFVASVSGAALLIVGSGLKRQMRASWVAAIVLLAAETVLSLAKGLHIGEALICVALIACLVAARGSFDRGGSALQAVSLRRLAAIAAAIAIALGVALVSGAPADWQNVTWWQVAFQADTPHFLRAILGASVVFALLVLWRTVHRPAGFAAAAPDAATVAAGVADAADPYANLAFLGDKCFLFDEDGGFIMYQVQRGTYLAMGDPVARDAAQATALVWRFRELAHKAGGEPAFYQVSAAALPIFIDAGFTFAKLGEEAVIDLAAFSMHGSRATRFRQMIARAERAGLTFELVRAADVAPLLPSLKPISEDWLARQTGREKGFSLGFWDEDYLARFDVAVIRHEGVPVAFANLWAGAGHREATIDLMRYRSDLPQGAMDYLFIALINALKGEGVERLSLGMAPLSGLAEHRLAPAWSRVGASVYRSGGAFFNFSGLRDYKAKFKPDWRPRYLAHTGARSVARVMIDATFIISRGPRGVGGGATAMAAANPGGEAMAALAPVLEDPFAEPPASANSADPSPAVPPAAAAR